MSYFRLIEFIIIIIGGSIYVAINFGKKYRHHRMSPWIILRLVAVITWISIFDHTFYLLGYDKWIIKTVSFFDTINPYFYYLVGCLYLLQVRVQLKAEEDYQKIKFEIKMIFILHSLVSFVYMYFGVK